MMQQPGLESGVFMDYLAKWLDEIPTLSISQAIGDPQKTAVMVVDVTNGFCKKGALSSPRVGAIVEPVVRLLQNAWVQGVNQFVLLQDTHEPDALEFQTWPAHCVRGTDESETVDEIKALAFYDRMTLLTKNSLSSEAGTGLRSWLAARPDLDTFIVTGDCTDLCVVQLAAFLQSDADAAQQKRNVIVPADCVNTYDFPVDAALKVGAMPHPGDFIHTMFLYYMALTGIKVTASIQ